MALFISEGTLSRECLAVELAVTLVIKCAVLILLISFSLI